MSGGDRPRRVAQLIKQEIADLLTREIKDPLPFLTVTDVHVGPDLRNARIAVSVMGPDEEVAAALQVLENYQGRLRRALGARVHLKYTPSLKFELDKSYEKANRLNDLFSQIAKDKLVDDSSLNEAPEEHE